MEAEHKLEETDLEAELKALADLNLIHAFGVYPTSIRDSVISLGDDAFGFIVGRHLAVWDYVKRRLSFLPRGQESSVVTATTRSPHGRLLAVAESVGGGPEGCDGHMQITISGLPHVYAPPPARDEGPRLEDREGILKVLHPTNKRLKIVDLAFSPDSRHLVTISDMPESTITYWRWEVEKIVCQHMVQLPITRIQVNPKNGHQISLSGPSYMRLWEYNPNDQSLNENASVFSLKQEKELMVVDHCWLREEAWLCAATQDGYVHIFEDGESRHKIEVNAVIAKDESQGPKAMEREQAKALAALMGGSGPTALSEPPAVQCVSLAPWSKGFVVGGSQGYLGVFKVDTKCQVENFGTFRMPGENSFLWSMSASTEDTHLTVLSYTEKEGVRDPSKSSTSGGFGKGKAAPGGGGTTNGTRTGTSASPAQTDMGDSGQSANVTMERDWSLTMFPVSQSDLAGTGQLEIFRPIVPMGVHNGAIASLATCGARRVVASCASDMELKVWNYPSQDCISLPNAFSSEMSIRVSPYEKAKRLAMHPLGFQVAVVLDDMLRIFHITSQGASRTLFDLPLKYPGDVAYSNSGGLLAVTSNNDVLVIDPWKGVLVRMFSGSGGHLSYVNQVQFSMDDRLLLSCSAAPSGAIYAWDMESEAKDRVFEHTAKGTDYAHFVHDFRRQLVVAVTRPDGDLRMIGHMSSVLVDLEADSPSNGYTAVELASPLGLLFAGTAHGSVRLFKWPIKAGGIGSNAYKQIDLHTHSITSLALSSNANLLFSGCLGGALMTCEVKPKTLLEGEAKIVPVNAIDQAYTKFRRLEDGSQARRPNREDQRKAADLQKKLYEATGSVAANTATLDQMVMLPKTYFDELQQEIRSLEERMASLKHEGDYALEQKEAENQEKLEAVQYERKHERTQFDEKYDSLFDQHKKALSRHAEEMKQANSDFEKRARSAQEEFEGKISLEFEKESRLLNELQGLKESHERSIARNADRQQEQLQELRNANEKVIRDWRAEYEKVCNLLKSDSLKFEEALRQQETEYEDQISEILELKRAVLQVESEKSTTALKDGVSMKQTIAMLQGSIVEYKGKLEESEKQRMDMQKQLEASREMFANVQEQLKEEKRALKVKGESLAKIREQMKHLESFRFVLFHKVKQMEEERDPLAEQVSSLKSSVRDMYSEFVREFRNKQRLDQMLNDKTVLTNSLQQENVVLNRNLIQLKKDGRRLLNDVEQVLHADSASDFERMPKRLLEVLNKYQKLSQWTPPQDDKEDPSAADVTKEKMMMQEMVIQRDLLFRKHEMSSNASNQIKRECSTDLRRLSSENAALITEMNMLRAENRSLLRSCKEQEAALIAMRAKETAKARTMGSSDAGSLSRADSAPDIAGGTPVKKGGALRGGSGQYGAAGGAAAGETPYVRRKVVDKQEAVRRHQQKALNQLPPVVQQGGLADPSRGKAVSQDMRFAQSLETASAARQPMEKQGFDVGRVSEQVASSVEAPVPPEAAA